MDGGLATLWIAQQPVGTTLIDGVGGVVVGASAEGGDGWRGSVDELAILEGVVTADDLRVLTTGFRGPTDASDCGDYDGDGLEDVVELDLGTDPTLRDSDQDTFDDGTEVGDVTRPMDTDQDGLIDALDADDDNDGLSSLIERISDADGDGAPDLDPDGDGLDNGRDDDSDGDGVPDAVEGTQDSDGDGVPDFLDAASDPTFEGDTGPPGSQGAGDSSDPSPGCDCAMRAAPVRWAWLDSVRRR